MRTRDDVGAVGRHDRQHGIRDPWACRRFLVLTPGPMGQFAFGEHIACLREGRYPTAIFEPRVPADMVGMQMRAHDEIDVIDREPARREVAVVAIGIHHVPEAAPRPRLVIADAGIDHDGVMRGLHDVALDAQDQPVFGIEKSGLQPPPVLLEQLAGHGREKLPRREERRLLLDNAVNGDVADFDPGGQDGLPIGIRGAPELARIALPRQDIYPPRGK